jgi:UDP-glucose 4-epimerase
MDKRRILITGGLGYAGGRVAQFLAGRDDLDIVLGSRRECASPSWLPSVRVVCMNWGTQESLLSVCDGVDTVLHLAAMNDSECMLDPVAALEINGVNTARLIEAAKSSGVRRFIYFSTAHIYGSPLVGEIDESTLPCSRHPYASSHRAAEDVVLAASSKMASIVLRLSNGFGVPTHAEANCWMLLINDLCRQVVIDRRLTLRSAGLQQRDFVTMHDIARAVAHMLDLHATAIGDGIFNLGGGRARRVLDMAEMIQTRCAQVLGFTPEIVHPAALPEEGTCELKYCIDKLLATGFSLTGDFAAEIDATLLLCQRAFGVDR